MNIISDQQVLLNREKERPILDWIQRSCIPFQTIEAGNGFDDLEPLKPILRDVKVIGLGEATHGTREFFQFKHRLVEFLVVEMGFYAFALEASWSACQPINDYILHGIGDPAEVLTGQGYIPWDTEEFAALVQWMRSYNQDAAEEQKVRFYGLDLWRNEGGRAAVLRTLGKFAPEKLDAAGLLFEALAGEEAKWPRSIDQASTETLARLLPQVQGLIDYFKIQTKTVANPQIFAEWAQGLQYLEVMKQWMIANAFELLPELGMKSSPRSRYMAENLLYLIDKHAPGTKFMVWAHNGHITKKDFAPDEKRLGYSMRERFEPGYFALGFEFNQGSFLTRTVQADQMLGPLKEVTLPPAPAGSFPWTMARAHSGNCILNLRAPVDLPSVKEWLSSPESFQYGVWVENEESKHLEDTILINEYDGIVFFDQTTAIRPTPNALHSSQDREIAYL